MTYRSISDDASDSHPYLTVKSKMEKVKKKYNDQKKPFCYRCAMIDWRKLAKQKTEELALIEINKGFVDFDSTGVIPKDFEKYGESTRFVWRNDTIAMDRVGNLAVTNKGVAMSSPLIKIGIHRDYFCIQRGCGISIYISNQELETLKDPIKDWSEKNPQEAQKLKDTFDPQKFKHALKTMTPAQRAEFYIKTELI